MMIVMFLNIMVTSQFLHRQQAKNLAQMTQNCFVEARVMLDKEKSHSKQKTKSRANRQKLGLTTLQANLDIIWMSLLKSSMKIKSWMTPCQLEREGENGC